MVDIDVFRLVPVLIGTVGVLSYIFFISRQMKDNGWILKIDKRSKRVAKPRHSAALRKRVVTNA